MAYEAVIGLEIHAHLETKTKMFCGCELAYADEPNRHTCPVCLAHPGSLPVLNEKAVKYAILLGLALDSGIAPFSQFHRKNYFYPDLPKAYQISQYDLPICDGGHLDLEMPDASTRRIGITRVHLEEDAAKLTHVGASGRISGAEHSLVDFNRGGTPLVEIVTEPDMRSPEEAKAFMQELRSILQHLGVSGADMEKGQLRCDANISMRPVGQEELGTKTELKNLNSFRALSRGLAAEIERQRDCLESGERIIQETRHYDGVTDRTISLRSKEEAHDYRYFPDPDLVPLRPDPAWIEDLRRSLPELPAQRRSRFVSEFGLTPYDAVVLTSSKAMGDYFETVATAVPDPKKAANWIQGELSFHLNSRNLDIAESPLPAAHLAELLQLIEDGTISSKMAKEIFLESFENGSSPSAIVSEKGMAQVSDSGELERIVDEVFAANATGVQNILDGNERAVGFLVGQVMKETKGAANPQVVNEIIASRLDALREG